MAGTIRYVSGDGSGDYNCDGSADQVEINEALSWANANPGNTVYMKGPFTYDITGQIKIGSNTTWTGDPTAVLRVHNYSAGNFPNGTPVVGQIGIPQNVEISGFTCDGNCVNQSNTLGYVGGKPRSSGTGYERFIGLNGNSTGSNVVKNVNIHHIHFHDSFGEAARISFAQGIKFHDCQCENHQHDTVLYVQVTGTGNEIYNCTIEGIDSDSIRLDSCENVDVHDNKISSYVGSNNNGCTERGENGIQIANELNKTVLTDNINVYNNTISAGLCGIWINDQRKGAGTNAQNVHIYNNKISDCGWACWAAWSAGISISPWGNGVVIENNTIDHCYVNGIQVTGAISSSSTFKVNVKNNNITNGMGIRSGASHYYSINGYGICNGVSTLFTVVAENNYVASHPKGNYYKVTPVSEATSPITSSLPDGGTTDDDPADPGDSGDGTVDTGGSGGGTHYIDSSIYIPPSVSIIDDDYEYIERDTDTSYINGIPFYVEGFSGSGSKSIGTSKSPSTTGRSISDFDFDGSDLTFDCIAYSPEELYQVLSAFYRRGKSTIELGGPYKGYIINGTGVSHKSSWSVLQGDTPKKFHPYTLNFSTEKPYMEKALKKVRSRYLYQDTLFSSDDVFVGNRVLNPSFEDWQINTSMTWKAHPGVADNTWRRVNYSPELNQFCAVADSGSNNTIMISPGNVTDLSGNGNTGILKGGVYRIDEGGLNFGGVDGYVDMGSLADLSLSPTTPVSICIKFKLETDATDNPASQPLINSTYVRMHIRYADNYVILRTDDSLVRIAEYPLGAGNTDWHTAVGTYSHEGTTETLKLFVDGELVSTVTAEATPTVSFGNYIGKFSSSFLSGDIQEARIYSRVLTDDEIEAFSNALDVSPSNLLVSYEPTNDDCGDIWIVPPGLTSAGNQNNQWRGLAWGSCIGKDSQTGDFLPGRWVATAITGTGNRAIYSDDGHTWHAGTTPADFNWGNVCYVRDDEAGIYRYVAVAYSGSGGRCMYSDNGGVTWTQVTTANDGNNWGGICYAAPLKRLVAVAYSGSSTQRAMYSDDFGATWTITTTPSGQYWTGITYADSLGLFVAISSNGTKQVITSPDGITWTAQDTPYSSSTTTTTGGTVVTTLSGQSPKDYNYTTLATSYDSTKYQSLQYTFILPALTNGHIYRIDQIHCQMRAVSSGPTITVKATIQAASINSGNETQLVEWTTKNTSYTAKSLDIAQESATNETVTIRFYLKTSSSSIRGGLTLMGYTATEITASGSLITYTRNTWEGITWAKNLMLLLAVADSGTGNRFMVSSDGINWSLGTSTIDNNYSSACFADEISKFVVVSTTGTGNRVITSDDYGLVKNIAPDSWDLTTIGQSRSSDKVLDGNFSCLIEGDGETKNPGEIYQVIPFDNLYDSGIRFILSATVYVEGLTSGTYRVDLYAGGTVIKELIWDVNTTDWSTKQIYYRFDNVPDVVYLRVHGSGTPNKGSKFYCEKVLVEKAADFEIASSGTAISTDGFFDVIPTVTVRGVDVNTSSSTTTRVLTDTTSQDVIFESSSTAYGDPVWTVTLPPLSAGSKYRLDSLSFQIKSSNPNGYIYSNITIQAASLFGGKENALAMWTTNQQDFLAKTYTLPYLLESASGETVILRYYIRISRAPYIAYATKLGYKVTETLVSTEIAQNSAIYLYNTADTRRVLKCCNTLPKGYMVQLKSDYTGSHRLSLNFTDGSYADIAYSISGAVARNSEKNNLIMPVGSSIVFAFDTLYPVVGIPFIKLYVVSGIPQISIANSGGTGTDGSPGTWWPVIGNTSANLENAELERELDAPPHYRLRGQTKYYVKIEPKAGGTCEFGQLLEYASLDTMDAQRFYIFCCIGPNTIGARVGDSGKCSAIVSLDYRDANILP